MKLQNQKVCAIAALLIGSMLPVSAAISIEIQVGVLRDASSSPVSDGSIWAVIIDENGDNQLPGGLTVSTSGSLTAANASQTYQDFAGKTIEADAMINGDRILGVFFVDGENTSGIPSISIQTIQLEDDKWQLYGGKSFAVYWFPDVTSLSSILPSTSGFQIGGIREINAGSGGDIPMVIPNYVENLSAAVTAAFLDNSDDVGGAISESRFDSISAIPEPSAVLLTLLGSAALLRRRRA